MAELGIVEGSLVQSPEAGVQINPQAFRKPLLEKGRAYAQAGEAVSGLFQDTTNMILQNRLAKQVFQADLNMRKRYDDFTASLVTMPDSGQWLPAWKEQSQAEKEQTLDDPHLSPDAKRIIGQKFDNWQEATTSSVNIAALKKGVNESRDVYHEDSTYAANTGHIDGQGGANDLADAAFANHVIDAKERDQDKKRFTVMGAESSANQAIARFPINTPSLLPTLKGWDNLNSARQRVLLHLATEAQKGQQAANLGTWSQQMDDSPTHDLDLKGLKAALDNNQISQKGYEGLVDRQKRLVAGDQAKSERDQAKSEKERKEAATAAAKEDRDMAGQIGTRLALDNFVGDKHPKQTNEDYMSDILGVQDGALRNSLIHQLQRKQEAAQKEGQHEDGPLVANALKYMNADFEAQVKPLDLGDKKPGTPRYERAQKQLEEDRLQHDKNIHDFLNVIRDPKNAEHLGDPEWINEQRQHIERPQAEVRTRAAITGKPTPHIVTNKAEYDAVPSGEQYTVDDVLYTKK